MSKFTVFLLNQLIALTKMLVESLFRKDFQIIDTFDRLVNYR